MRGNVSLLSNHILHGDVDLQLKRRDYQSSGKPIKPLDYQQTMSSFFKRVK